MQTQSIHPHWSDTQDDPTQATMEWASAAVFSPTLELYVVGAEGSPSRAVARKYDATGNVAWCRVFDWGSPSAESEALVIAQGPDGHVITAGTIDDGWSMTRKDLVVTKVDLGTGADLWKHVVRLDGRARDDDIPRQIVVDGAGDVYLAAHLYDGPPLGLADIGLYKISGHSGRVLWHTRVRSTQGGTGLDLHDEFARMALTSSGCLLVAGTLIPGGTGGGPAHFGSPLVQALDCRTGRAQEIPIPVPLSFISLCDIAVDPITNRFALAGSTFSGGDFDVFVAKFSSDRRLEWYSSFAPTGVADECLLGVDLASNGDVVVVGTSDHAGDMQWLTLKYHFAIPPPRGSMVLPVWGRYFQAGTQAHGFDVPLGVRFDLLGNIAIAGVAEVTPGGPHRMVDLRYSGSGTLLPGSPTCAAGWTSPGADVVSGWAFDEPSCSSAMVGFVRDYEPGQTSLLTDWAVYRSGP